MIDNALSPTVAHGLRAHGHDAIHVRDVGLRSAPDHEVLAHASREGRVLLSADTDFATLLARTRARGPSVILFRHGAQRQPAAQVALLIANLGALSAILEAGAVVSIEPARVRYRMLPLL